MPNQVLTIEPQNELKFKVDYTGLFELGHTTYMQLTNPSEHTVLFKIKTTAPKKYCVRPNSGVLSPNSKVDIAITPQPVHVDNNEKHKHKFMVQSVIAPEGKTNIDQVWKEISPEQLMDYKLKCVFESPRGANINDSGDTAPPSDIIKKRAPAEDAKSLTKTSFPKSENLESDLQKATNEVIHLREEESKLRHENLRLKEELLRLHQGGETRMQRGHSYGPEKTEQMALMPWIATAIGMALLGIIIGKFIM
ncbi:vesicle-associated membrane protein-associated protein B isoform X3 [Maniola hyperantus]|uniref:vesicle-associated membrane protein-associated protein B isoform X3 n=1 Tax=Aphantopus hyperantus TaxID=2795564 RepID=UPI00156A30BD|nr:vesicle-associated membrane protein-associated protein B isoform X3 [Maniola hyperantus]